MGKQEDIKSKIIVAIEQLTDLSLILDALDEETLDNISDNLDSTLDTISHITFTWNDSFNKKPAI